MCLSVHVCLGCNQDYRQDATGRRQSTQGISWSADTETTWSSQHHQTLSGSYSSVILFKFSSASDVFCALMFAVVNMSTTFGRVLSDAKFFLHDATELWQKEKQA